MISGDAQESMDRTIGLSLHRGVMRSNPDAQPLLAVLSMLPAGTTGKNLKWWVNNQTSAALNTLRTAALIEQDDAPNFATSRIFVRPTIQAYMSRKSLISADVQDRVHAACYKFVLDHEANPDKPHFKDNITALQGEETNIQGLLMQINAQDLRPKALDALIAFSTYQSWTKPSTVVAFHALEVAKAAHDDPRVPNRHVAEATQCLGKILLTLDRYEEASQNFEDACRWFKTLPDGPDLHRAGECSMELAQTYMYDKRDKSGGEVGLIALQGQADLSHDPSQTYYVARGLLGLGFYQSWAIDSDFDQAVPTLSTARKMFEELECPASASTAECLFRLTRCYMKIQDYAKALLTIEEALVTSEPCGEGDLTCRILIYTAECLLRLERYDEAAGVIERNVSLSQALGRPLAIAQMWERLGYNCAARMDLSGALLAYKLAQFEKINSFAGRRGAQRCADNLRKLRSMTKMDQVGFATLMRPNIY
jgi:tetratricopeptide (TPR) repeat protein